MWWSVLLLAGSALADDSKRIRFEATPGAEIVVFPRTEPTVIELGVYRNRVPIGAQLDGVTSPGVLDADAVGVGGGTHMITLHLDRDDLSVRPQVEGGQVTLWLYKTAPKPIRPKDEATLESVLANLDKRKPIRPMPVPLTPLRGDAITTQPTPAELKLHYPRWAPPETDGRHGMLLQDERASLRVIDRMREVLTLSEDPVQEQIAVFRLANAYLEIGMPREAKYYADLAIASEDIPPATAYMLRAASDIRTGAWDSARRHCVKSHEKGASPAQTLRCLGMVSLGSGYPSPADTATALLGQSDDIDNALLASWLYQRDHRHDLALEVLDGQRDHADPAVRDAVLLARGDSLYHLTRIDDAKAAWDQVTPAHPRHDLVHDRLHLADLAKERRANWLKQIPELRRRADMEGVTSAEAAYLLAQIYQAHGDMRGASEHLSELMRKHRAYAWNADIPERLLLVCRERLAQLHSLERYVEEVAAFNDCWVPDLDSLTPKADTLLRVSRVMRDLGISEDALGVHKRALAIQTTLGDENAEALIGLADLYNRTRRYEEALETLEYTRRHSKPTGAMPHLVTGRAHEGLGDAVKAERAYRVALTAAPKDVEIRRVLGLFLAHQERCKEALTLLAEDSDRDASLARSRCKIRLGDLEGAHADSVATATDADDEWTRDQASWLASVAALKAGPTPDFPEETNPTNPMWSTLLEEERAIESLKAQISGQEDQKTGSEP